MAETKDAVAQKVMADPQAFQQQPISESIKKLDQHLSGQDAELWLAWCSVRTAFLDGPSDI